MENVKSFLKFIKESASIEREPGPYYAIVYWDDYRGYDPVHSIYPSTYEKYIKNAYNRLVEIDRERQSDAYAEEELGRMRRRGEDVDLRPGSPYAPDLHRGFSPEENPNIEIIGPFMEIPEELLAVMSKDAIDEFNAFGIYEQ